MLRATREYYTIFSVFYSLQRIRPPTVYYTRRTSLNLGSFAELKAVEKSAAERLEHAFDKFCKSAAVLAFSKILESRLELLPKGLTALPYHHRCLEWLITHLQALLQMNTVARLENAKVAVRQVDDEFAVKH